MLALKWNDPRPNPFNEYSFSVKMLLAKNEKEINKPIDVGAWMAVEK